MSCHPSAVPSTRTAIPALRGLHNRSTRDSQTVLGSQGVLNSLHNAADDLVEMSTTCILSVTSIKDKHVSKQTLVDLEPVQRGSTVLVLKHAVRSRTWHLNFHELSLQKHAAQLGACAVRSPRRRRVSGCKAGLPALPARRSAPGRQFRGIFPIWIPSIFHN